MRYFRRNWGGLVNSFAWQILTGIKFFKWRIILPENMRAIAKSRPLKDRGLHFAAFAKQHICTSGPFTVKQLAAANALYDVFITGSDQVWNPAYCCSACFLDFAAPGKTKAAYAASIGIPVLPDGTKRAMQTALKEFDYISVREKEAQTLLEPLLQRKVKVALDPTLLLTKTDWQMLEERIDVSPNYLLCCVYGTSREHRLFARKAADKLGLKLVLLMTSVKEIKLGEGLADIELIDVSPGQFLTLIKNAGMVLTDSFHFMAFSIIYRKKFYVMKRNADAAPQNTDSRFYALLHMLSLEDRLIDTAALDKITVQNDLYQGKDEKLDALREDSLAYLKKIIGE